MTDPLHSPAAGDAAAAHTRPLVVVHNHPPESGPIEDPEGEEEATTSADVEQLKTIFAYLSSPEGHEIASRFMGVVEKWQQGMAMRGSTMVKLEKIAQLTTIAVIIAAGVGLAAFGKFSNELGILFAAIIAVVFSQQKRG